LKLRYYIIRRILLLVPTLFGLTLIVFALTHAGGNQRLLGEYINTHSSVPVAVQEAQLSQRFHFGDPLIVQYFYWLSAFVQGDWGYTQTAIYDGTVISAITLFFPATLVLAVFSSILTGIIGIPLGVWSAVRKDSVLDQATRVASFAGYSIPIYWLGLILIIVFASNTVSPLLNIFPISGTVNPSLAGSLSWYSNGVSYPTHIMMIDALLHGRLDVFVDAVMHLVLPVVTLTYGILAGVLRVMRSSMQDTLNQDYIRTARAKGLPENIVVNVHARRNALIPVFTILGYLIASLLGGVVLIEAVFNYVGIGYWTTQALLSGDVGGIMGATVIFGLAFVFANLVVDILYGFLDPRIRY
jgi:ABC-type dipeptide/oligopeptide/nickel transport system permease component